MVLLFNAQKPIKRQGWCKGKFALFQRPATCGEREGRCLSKGQLPITDSQGARAFINGKEATCRNCTSVIGGLISVSVVVLSIVCLQFQGGFVPIALRLVLETVPAYVMVIVWSSWS